MRKELGKGAGKLETARQLGIGVSVVQRVAKEVILGALKQQIGGEVIPEMAQTVGISKSAVSREFIEASEEELRKSCERGLDQVEFLVIYLDGMEFPAYALASSPGFSCN